MSQTVELIATLKKCLRARGLTYKDVARSLELSEASVKRIFAERNFTVARLEAVCDLLEISIYELSRMSRPVETSHRLSLTQEDALAKDPALFMYFHLLLNGWTARGIARQYNIEDTRATRMLTRLDRVGLIELLPRNRVRLLTPRAIAWRQNGPVRRAYETQAKTEFLRASFSGKAEQLQFAIGELTEASMAIIIRKMERLKAEFEELVELDLTAPEERRQNTGLLLAFRPWVFEWLAKKFLDAKAV